VFIQPDIQGEARFTTQGTMAVMSYGGFSTGNVGYVQMTYEIEMWESTFGITLFNSATQVPSWCISTGNTGNQTLNDNIGGPVYVKIPVGGDAAYASLTASTVYQVVPSYTLGNMKSWQIYYFKTPSSMTPSSVTLSNLYKTNTDAFNQTEENTVDGSYLFMDIAPTEGFWYVIPVSQDAVSVKIPPGESSLPSNCGRATSVTTTVGSATTTVTDIEEIPNLIQKLSDFVKVNKN